MSGSSTSSVWRQDSYDTNAKVVPGSIYRFVRRSEYNYDPRCVAGEEVKCVKVGGYPPAQVRWASGFTYWVNEEDLAELSANEALSKSVKQVDIIPNASFNADLNPKKPGKSLKMDMSIPDMPDMPRRA